MGIGIWQLLLLLAIVFVVFGTGKLPGALKDLGKGLKSLKNELQSDSEDKKDKENNITDVTPKKNKKK